jgi:hypothetical protein
MELSVELKAQWTGIDCNVFVVSGELGRSVNSYG